jgi:hypothetical protein
MNRDMAAPGPDSIPQAPQPPTAGATGGDRHALSYLPYNVFDADLGERRSSGRPSSVRPSSVLCESQRRLLSV